MLLQITEAGYYLIGATIIFILFFLIFFLFYRNVIRKRNEMFLNEEKIKVNFRQTLLQSQLEIQEQTLKNISQEIHDNVGQVLSLAKLNLNTIDISKTEELQKKIESALIQVSKAINDLRDLSKSFNTDNISALGLVRAVEYELDMIKKTGVHKTSFNVEGKIKKLEPQTELILFRIVQETLHNIIKHAEASSIWISARYTENDLGLEIKDNGKGFHPTAEGDQDTDSGLGIRNMHNRARLICAKFNLNSIKNEGTSVTIVLPFVSKQNSTEKNENL